MMKQVKGFVKTCYSETLVLSTGSGVEGEKEEAAGGEEKETSTEETTYHNGLGIKFKFPGDPKKYVSHLYPPYKS